MKKLTAVILSVILTAVAIVPAYGYGFSVEADYSKNQWINNDQMSVIGMTGVAGDWDEIADMGEHCDEIVPRWYMARYVCNMVNLAAEKPDGYEILFYDLSSENENYAEIKAVVNAGYMQGDPDGKFRPNEPITTMEAARVLLNVLGYKQYIAVKGFQSALKQTEILDGVPVADELNQAQIMRMIYNTYMSPAIRQEGISADGNGNVLDVELVLDPDYLGLEHLFGIIYSRGVLDGASGTTLTKPDESIKVESVLIDGVSYDYVNDLLWEDPTDMLGYNVDFYYEVLSDGTRLIRYMHPNDKNEELILDHNSIASFSGGVYKYYGNGDKVKTIGFDNTTKILYNGVADIGYDDAGMIPSFGTVTFIDNDGKSGYEVIKIENYDFYYVSAVNADAKKIYDQESGKTLDVNGADVLTILSEGKEIAFDRIKKGNMLAVKRSGEDSSYEEVVIEVIKPTVKKVKLTSVGEETLEGGGVSYDKWKNLIVEMGKTYTLFEYGDEIVMAVEEDGGAEYGYLISAGVDGVFESKTLSFWIVDMDGNNAVYEGAKRLSVDGVSKSPEEILSVLSQTADESNGKSAEFSVAQPIMFELNNSGKLLRIDTLYEESENSAFISPSDDSNLLRYQDYNTALYDNTDLSKNIAAIDSSTEVLFVPSDRSDETSYWNKGFINLVTYKVDVCNRDEAGVADVVFAYYDPETEGIFESRRCFIVSGLRAELNSETNDVEYIAEGYLQSTFRSYKMKKEYYDKLSIGDVIRFEVDKNGEIISYQLVFDVSKDYSNRDSRYVGISGAQYPMAVGYKMVYGTPISVSGNFIKITQSMPDDVEGWDPEFNSESYQVRNCSFWKYSEVHGAPIVEAASASDIVTYIMDPENASKVVVNVGQHAEQIYIINK